MFLSENHKKAVICELRGPISLGGGGFRSLADTAGAAFISSWIPFFTSHAKQMGMEGSVGALFQKWETENHELAHMINEALLTIPNRATGGKTFTDALSSVADGESFQETIAGHLKGFFLADAKAAHAVGVSPKIAEREAIRIDDKAHSNAHFWLTVLPTDPMLTLCW